MCAAAMQYEEALVGLAEVGIGLAGFVAILVAINGKEIRTDPVSSNFSRLIVVNSLWVLLSSLSALGLLSLELDQETVWQLTSAIALAMIVALGFLAGHEEREIHSKPSRLARITQITAWLLGVTATVVLLANTIGLPITPSFGWFFLAVMCMIVITAMEFLYLVYSLLKE
jgi:hypothetical protein